MCKDTENGKGCGVILQCCKVPGERVEGAAKGGWELAASLGGAWNSVRRRLNSVLQEPRHHLRFLPAEKMVRVLFPTQTTVSVVWG